MLSEAFGKLLAADYDVLDSVENGRDLVDAAKREKPDLVIVDITQKRFSLAPYAINELFNLFGGYRILAFDYQEGTGATRLKLDLKYSGPMLGFAYRF
jgi:DNA-binding NarL/FixJ family response regulator